MTVAAQRRQAMAAVGADLAARDGDAGERRGAALLRALAGNDNAAPMTWDDLLAAPAWLRLPLEAQRELAVRVALVSIAPQLASSIDGGWLGGHAAVAGEETLDWAAGRAADVGDDALAPIAGEALEARGWQLLRATLPPAFADMIVADPTPDATADRAARLVAIALEAPR